MHSKDESASVVTRVMERDKQSAERGEGVSERAAR